MQFIRIIVASLVVLVTSFFVAPTVSAQDRFSEIAVDFATGEILLGTNENELRHPASLTKMMTLYLLFDALENGDVTLDTRIVISRRAAQQSPTRLGFRCARRARTCGSITVDTAIDALVVQSANDVASAVAEHLGRTESNFALRMTRRAQAMGMTSTVFTNASGLPSVRQVTTAHDMAILGRRLIQDFPDYYERFNVREFSYGRRVIRGHNRVLDMLDGVDGIKTGYTRASGFNLVSSAVRGDRRVVTVVLGGPTAAERDAQMVDLIGRAFERETSIQATYPYIVTPVARRYLDQSPLPGLPIEEPSREPPLTLAPLRRDGDGSVRLPQ